jgi:uncharacterized protein YyaL (SSP411 family)
MDLKESPHANRLIHETSPYLLQHARNPVDWYPWGEEAFQKAKAENKPILLSIGYSACHWCHVMERESFENERIAALMNDLFINIKVDREERPDLDEIYMNAVQMLTGRGGWPMTVFLTPEGQPFYGGTYFPPEDRHGMPGFAKILDAVARAYQERPEDVRKSVDQILETFRRMSLSQPSQRPFAGDTIAHAAEQLTRAYDPDHGGFGQAPKFPNAGVYELFLRHYHHSKDSRFLGMVVHTLTQMAKGGIYDHLGGGFHRYSVDEKWLVPHFEKMLYDNAQLVRIFALVYRVTGIELFKGVVAQTVGYLHREMFHSEGGFYSTQDADSEGDEGKFYVWDRDEICRILGDDVGEIFSRIYDVGDPGSFEGQNILHPVLTWEQAGKLFRRDPVDIERLMGDARRRLFEARENRIKPFRDEKIIVSWNGLMLSGLAEAIKVGWEAAYIEAANRTLGLIFNRMFRDGLLLHVYKDGVAKCPGYLDDYAFLAAGLLDLYEATFDNSALDRANRLATIMIDEFWDDAEGGFFYTGKSHEKLLSRTKPVFDASVPSGNALATQLLLRLHYFTGRIDYLTKAEKVLRLNYDPMVNQPFGFAHMLCALDFYLRKPKEIVLVGELKDPETRELAVRIGSLFLPNKTLRQVSPTERLETASPLLRGKSQVNNRATVYVCHDSTCSAPVTTWTELVPLLEA